MQLSHDEIADILRTYNILSFQDFHMIDSSHGDADIRQNYIIDNRFVLRINTAKVMTENRIRELNALVKRYNDFGFRAPYFLPQGDGTYVWQSEGYCRYLSEYLDYEVADNVKDSCRAELIKERVVFVAKFSQAHKNLDLIDTMSMYSIFELSPYDELLTGIDEKQDNFNALLKDLEGEQEHCLAEKLKTVYENGRKELQSFYKELPRCVYQGDENFSNLCVDEENHIIGLFDFNMSGTDVIVNYLANIAFQGNYYYTDEIVEQYSEQEIFDMVMNAYKENTTLIHQYYMFTDKEVHAYKLYSKIVMLSGYCNQQAFSNYLKNEKHKKKIVALLHLIAEAEL